MKKTHCDTCIAIIMCVCSVQSQQNNILSCYFSWGKFFFFNLAQSIMEDCNTLPVWSVQISSSVVCLFVCLLFTINR